MKNGSMNLTSIIFGGIGVHSRAAEVSLLGLRLFAGLSMAIAHGWGKMPPPDRFIAGVEKMGFPLPELFAWAAASSEFFGGILLAVGLATRPSAFFIMCTMLVAGFIRHADDPFGSMEKALLYAVVMLVFVVIGGGRYAADRRVEGFLPGRRRSGAENSET